MENSPEKLPVVSEEAQLAVNSLAELLGIEDKFSMEVSGTSDSTDIVISRDDAA